MKKQRYIVEIEMPDGDFISDRWLKDLIRTDCDVEDEGRKKVTVQETSLLSNLDEAAWEYFVKTYGIDNIAISEDIKIAVKFGAEWMAGQGESHETEIVSRVTGNGLLPAVTCLVNKSYKEGDKVVVQIRKEETK